MVFLSPKNRLAAPLPSAALQEEKTGAGREATPGTVVHAGGWDQTGDGVISQHVDLE